jgi:DNA invertase Pin-like site-specific DNA recombinase
MFKNDKDLLSGEEGFDTSTGGGRMMPRLLFSMAEWEREVPNESWDAVKTKVVRERRTTLGHAGLGYVSGPGRRLTLRPGTAARPRVLGAGGR